MIQSSVEISENWLIQLELRVIKDKKAGIFEIFETLHRLKVPESVASAEKFRFFEKFSS